MVFLEKTGGKNRNFYRWGRHADEVVDFWSFLLDHVEA